MTIVLPNFVAILQKPLKIPKKLLALVLLKLMFTLTSIVYILLPSNVYIKFYRKRYPSFDYFIKDCIYKNQGLVV
jgi:hypothetical protein